jgi:hypothetical protein
VAVHSIAGCFIYGAFLAKIILVAVTPLARSPAGALPLVGGTAGRNGRGPLVHERFLVLQRLQAALTLQRGESAR